MWTWTIPVFKVGAVDASPCVVQYAKGKKPLFPLKHVGVFLEADQPSVALLERTRRRLASANLVTLGTVASVT